jgi:hypothetical protein
LTGSYAAWGPKGQSILAISASFQNTLQVFSPDGKKLAEFQSPEETLESAALSPAGDRLMTVSSSDVVRVWQISSVPLQDAIRNASTACLTLEERREYLKENPEAAQRGSERCEDALRRRM